MATTEHTLNDALAEVLRGTRRLWRNAGVVSSENTGMLKGNAQRPDILVVEPDTSPVVIETEFLPAVTVEPEACSRLGQVLSSNGRTILSSLAVRVPKELRTFNGAAMRAALHDTTLEFALYTGHSPMEASRWPEKGWLRAKLADLSTVVQSASVPPEIIERAADELVAGVSAASALLSQLEVTHPGSLAKLSMHLCQEETEQTWRMACTILTNALVFHEALAGGTNGLEQVLSLDEIVGKEGSLTKHAILEQWRLILDVNYWPIFDIAKRMLEVLPASKAGEVLQVLASTASRLVEGRLMRSHDLTGAVFQKLIADRKFLAAYYTTPASAALLAGIALDRAKLPSGGDWENREAVRQLRVADFACGTGTLLSSAYQRLGQLHELAGGDMELLHADMMGHVLVGCDVLPAAAHLTASMLSGVHPTVQYTGSRILNLAYGLQSDGRIGLGSLDLLDPQQKMDIVAITGSALEATGQSLADLWEAIPHTSFDIVIMNPPFTRSTNHEGDKKEVLNPAFAAFGTDEKTQKAMAARLKKIAAGTAFNGNAGEASAFLAIADKKLSKGGTLAFVLPLSLLGGADWENARKLLRRGYKDICVLTIAASRARDMSFSADTGMAECLIVATKAPEGSDRATFITLNDRPRSQLEGVVLASEISRLRSEGVFRRIEDDPMGGTQVLLGETYVGSALTAPLPDQGPWRMSRVKDASLAQMCHKLLHTGDVHFPGELERRAQLPICSVQAIGEVGPLHRDVNGTDKVAGVSRGPFDIGAIPPGHEPTVPVLWAHNAKAETRLIVEPDSEANLRSSDNEDGQLLLKKRAQALLATMSHIHFNYDFQFNSQPLSACYSRVPCLGGRAWPSIKLWDVNADKAFVLWSNCTLGMLLHWWQASKNQSGRGSITLSSIGPFRTLNLKSLSTPQLNAAATLFDELAARDMLPLNEIVTDEVRRTLDARFLVEILGIDAGICEQGGALERLRRKIAAEPSIKGTKRVQTLVNATALAAE